MLSRRHVRLKTMQVLYAYWQGGKEAPIEQLEKQLHRSFHNFYKLYLYELLFLKEFLDYLSVYDSQIKNKSIPQAEGLGSHLKLQRLPLANSLFESPELTDAFSTYQVVWQMEESDSAFKKILIDLKNTELFREFESSQNTEQLAADLLSYILRVYPQESSLLSQHLEETFLNVSDDQKIIKGMLKKTISNHAKGKEPLLAPLYLDKENTLDYGLELLARVTNHFEENDALIKEKITKWEPNQIAIVDSILLHMGVAEFKYFPSIPATVTINEYVEMAKGYSPPESKGFINGVLEAIKRDLINKKVDKS